MATSGTTTFNLPDLRGEFVRGWDHARGADVGRTLGSTQTDAIREITGTVTALLRDSGEQWNDQAKQDLVSTAFISAAKTGVIIFDFDVEVRP